jgi:hypothetical protein
MANKTPIRLREVGDTIEIIVDKKREKNTIHYQQETFVKS